MGLEIDRRAVITGAANGIGFEAARLLQQEGARRLLTDRDEQTLTARVDRLGGESDSISAVAAHLITPAGAEARFTTTDRKVGVVVLAAGVSDAGSDLLTDVTEGDWNSAAQIDFVSDEHMVRAFAPAMAKRGWGHTAFVTSANASRPSLAQAVGELAMIGAFSVVKVMGHIDAPRALLDDAVAPAFQAPAGSTR